MNGIIPRIEVGALGGHPSFLFPLSFSLLHNESVLLSISALRGAPIIGIIPPHRL